MAMVRKLSRSLGVPVRCIVDIVKVDICECKSSICGSLHIFSHLTVVSHMDLSI